jgi:hypothetical protein
MRALGKYSREGGETGRKIIASCLPAFPAIIKLANFPIPSRWHRVCTGLYSTTHIIMATQEHHDMVMDDIKTSDQGKKARPVQLQVLIGEWQNETYFKDNPGKTGVGKIEYEWMGGGYFIVEQFADAFPNNESHNGICIIEYDGGDEDCTGHFFDNMGYHRHYHIGIHGDAYTIRGKWERYFGEISADKNSIRGTWEQSKDGANWEYLCDTIMTRRKD